MRRLKPNNELQATASLRSAPVSAGVVRHKFMRFVVALTLWTALGVADEAIADNKAPSTASYHVVHGWPSVPEGQVLGWVVSGVGVDSRGDVFVFHRAGREWDSEELDLTPIPRPTVLRFDGSTGALKASWGENRFAMPHGLTIDEQDNVWLTDVALQQVYKFSPDGKLLLTIGEKGVAGKDARHFDRPTKVAVAGDGSFYVSDGYRNSRVAKFAADGRFLMEWGTKGAAAGQFDLPHGIALDKQGHIYVADRTNARVQIFDPGGKHIATWQGTEYGRPFDVAVGVDGTVFIADGGDLPKEPPDRSCVIVVRPDGKVLERFGRFGVYDSQLYRAHDIAVGKDGAVFVGDANGRVQKFVKVRQAQ